MSFQCDDDDDVYCVCQWLYVRSLCVIVMLWKYHEDDDEDDDHDDADAVDMSVRH